ncbi:helicase DnaB [Paenibacillus sp. NEAU-GSW1]|uniref:helicase DnaB n=1 Tax=Paenibacillus sp. NEAU-GSW1 TaxID=2682486 RepID=UPI0012E31223|nr:helicase DnaB [Paenibacillus sp. NEAU-GSW1]MUT64324.1 helicase DnaB [Paenibacillus sp. NEAU-GSW1]
MRIGNLLQYTEHHRYYIFRDFSLNSLDYKMLSLIYQPMIGAFAVALFQQLYHGIAEGTTGYSPIEPQRKLFLGLGLDMNEKGRKYLIEQTSRLEAVGLLQTSRLGMPDQADVIYEYELSQPLSPGEFFRNQHLTLLLRDKIGKYAVIALREQFGAQEPDELADAKLKLSKENISVPFYELFQLNAQSVDFELEQALTEVAPTRQAAKRPQLETAGIPYGDIILRFPRNSANRSFVERLRNNAEELAQINYVAYKYSLSVADICRLLDEDGIFTHETGLDVDELGLRANQLYRQDKKREGDRQRNMARIQAANEADAETEIEEVGVQEEYYLNVPAQLQGRCDIQQYNMLMRNEPHTRFLHRFFPGAVPDWMERTFERIDLNYRLPAPVINVLIHYVIGSNDSQRVTKTFIEAVVSNMLMKQIDDFEKAVLYVREQAKVEAEKERRKESPGGSRATGRAGTGRSGGASRKPSIPIVQDSGARAEQSAITPEKLEQMRKLARKLDGK